MKEAQDNLVLEIMEIINEISNEMLERHGGCQILTNLGNYQDVKHLHWHVALK